MRACCGWLASIVCVGLLTGVSLGQAEDATAPRVGRQIDDFALTDFRGRTWSLAEFADRPVVVVAVLGNDCPLVKLYARRLVELATEYQGRGVQFLAINANRQDSLNALGAFARQQQIEFPLLKDPRGDVIDRLGAARTPEVFVLDSGRTVRYHGRIDDQYGVGVQRAQVGRRDLAIALDELLAGQAVSVSETEAPGCLIGRVPTVEPHGEVTYCNQVARLLQAHCVSCHRPGEVGPFPLTTYEEVAGWAPMIREVVSQRRMPPWFADPRHGRFANEARLSDAELATLFAWIDHGTPEGDAAELPSPRQFATGWQIDEPDAVYYMSDEPCTIPATGVMDYQNYEIDPGFTEDRWVQAAEARPGNRAVVHHHLAYFIPPGGNRQMSQVANQIAGYAPGSPPFVYPQGTALRIPAGSKIVFQMHYTPVGYETTDRSYLGLKFVPADQVEREVHNEITGNIGIRIPPGDPDYALASKRRFKTDTLLLNLAPHMHLRGKAFRFELERPDGSREVLLDVPRYDFNWQLRYDLAEPLLVPSGSRLHCYARFDNSADNPANPDPTAEVHFGEQTWEEMMFGVFQTVSPVGEHGDTAQADAASE
ncbi:MAG: redoxin domain-containing protein [Pirellulales bacterium]|nr:redoxin domain-containing protein [Pirellulales bacterium]